MIKQRISKNTFSFLFLVGLLFGFRATAQTVDPNAVDGQLHVKLSTDPGLILDGYTGGNLALDAIFLTSGLDSIYKPFPLAGTALDSVYRVVFPNAAQVDALIPVLEALPYIEYVEKNPIVFPTLTPNDLLANQWSLVKIDAELAWNYTTGSASVLVAILDDAIAIDHQDLAANIYTNSAEDGGFPLLDDDGNGRADDVNGFDVADNDADPRPPANASGNDDGFSHGTHVAGIVGAATNNGVGMASIGYSVKILPVKISDDANGNLTGGLDGLFYATRSGVDVINMSWGLYDDVATLKSLIQQAAVQGIVLVAAAGNDGDQVLFYPAAYPDVISVGATDQNDAKASFSNYGSTIDVMAPGVGIYSTLPEGNNTYGNKSGTSMAAPMVSGLVALVKSHFPGMSATQVQQRIENSCQDISAQNPTLNGQIGAGRINAYQTLGNVSISELNGGTFSIYPNPTRDRINLKKSATDNVTSIAILDVSGREVISSSWVESLNVSNLASGIYTVLIEANGNLSQTKMMIQ
jgi:serine protease